MVVRPMREHTLKEVAFYNRLFSVPSVFTPTISTKVRAAPWLSWVGYVMSRFLQSQLSLTTGPRQEQYPPAGGRLPAGTARAVPLHSQHRI